MSNVNSLDLWIVQLDDLIKHALKIRDANVMNYKRNAKKAFEMGINMIVLLMKHMVEDMVEDKNIVAWVEEKKDAPKARSK